MAPRLGAAVSWTLVAASLGFWSWWALRPKPQPVAIVAVAVAAGADLTPLLGAPPSAGGAPVLDSPGLASRIRLLGVVAPREGLTDRPRGGVALLAVDGKPPRPYRVGARLDSELMLQAVGQRTATIATVAGEPRLRLELPLNALTSANAAPATPALRPAMPPPLRRAIGAELEDAERQLPQPGDPVAPPPPPGPDPQQQAVGSR